MYIHFLFIFFNNLIIFQKYSMPPTTSFAPTIEVVINNGSWNHPVYTNLSITGAVLMSSQHMDRAMKNSTSSSSFIDEWMKPTRGGVSSYVLVRWLAQDNSPHIYTCVLVWPMAVAHVIQSMVFLPSMASWMGLRICTIINIIIIWRNYVCFLFCN